MDEKIRDYRILQKLGEGGMGTVYLARDEELGREVAIKALAPELTRSGDFVERFRNEARLQASLMHPNIVTLHSFFQEQNQYYMVLEYARGITLKDLIHRTGPIPEERTLFIFRQIAEALGYAHGKGIIHRDLKPANIILDENDTVKVMDFGIAKLLGDKGMTKTGTKMGTLYYMSPEQIKAVKDIDQRTDIYSLGMTLYEMLAGRLPFDVSDDQSEFEVMTAIVSQEFPMPTHFYPHISNQTVELVRRSLEKKRESRLENAAEMIGMVNGGQTIVTKNARPKIVVPRSGSPVNIGIQWISVEGESFLISATTITFEQYDRYCDDTGASKPSDNGWGRGKRPVINVNVADAAAYCNWLSKGMGTTVRLPEVNEWKYAALGGKNRTEYKFSGSNSINEVAWYADNSENKTHEVATKKPNEIGIYDMSGNVWEWCGASGAIRGGSWESSLDYCCVDYRFVVNSEIRNAGLGFRVLQK